MIETDRTGEDNVAKMNKIYKKLSIRSQQYILALATTADIAEQSVKREIKGKGA